MDSVKDQNYMSKDSSSDKCQVTVEQSNAVVSSTELTVSNAEKTSNNGSLSSQPDTSVPCVTYTSTLNEDDIMTDEDIELLLEGKSSSACISLGCSHMASVQPIPKAGVDIKKPCAKCNSTDENWICLTCYEVYCSRYVNKHMVEHTQETNHPIALSFIDITVWCYGCDDYIYGDPLDKVRNEVINAKYGSLEDGLKL